MSNISYEVKVTVIQGDGYDTATIVCRTVQNNNVILSLYGDDLEQHFVIRNITGWSIRRVES